MAETTASSLGERAKTHVQYLAETIGPRPTGSSAEEQALTYAENNFQQWGLKTLHDPVIDIQPHRRIRWIGVILVTVITVALMLTNLYPWLPAVVLFGFLFVVLPILRRRMQRPYPGGLASFNLIAEQHPTNEIHQTLILGAHIDTASAGVYHDSGWRKRWGGWLGFSGMVRSLFMIILLQLLSYILSDEVFGILLQIFRVYLALNWLYIMSVFVERYHHPDRFAPGANDNASGVGTVMALAEHFAQNPPQNTRLRFMLFCGEEVGLVGSTRFVEKLQDTDRLYAITFDMVGMGDTVEYVRRTSNLLKGTDKRLNALFAEAGAKGGSFFTLGASDYDSFARNGIPATGIYTSGEKMIFKVYHTTSDTLEYIDAACLEKTIHTAIEVISKLDQLE